MYFSTVPEGRDWANETTSNQGLVRDNDHKKLGLLRGVDVKKHD